VFQHVKSAHVIHKPLITNFYHILVKQLSLTPSFGLSLLNLSFVPSVTTPQNWSLY